MANQRNNNHDTDYYESGSGLNDSVMADDDSDRRTNDGRSTHFAGPSSPTQRPGSDASAESVGIITQGVNSIAYEADSSELKRCMDETL